MCYTTDWPLSIVSSLSIPYHTSGGPGGGFAGGGRGPCDYISNGPVPLIRLKYITGWPEGSYWWTNLARMAYCWMQFFEWWESFSWAGVVEVAINSAWLFGFETAKKLTDCQRSLELHVGHMVSLNMRDTSKWPSTMAKLIHFFPTIFRQSPWYYRKTR